MATVVQDLVNQALMDLHSIAQGESPNAVESAVALAQLNRIVSSFSLDGTFVYTQQLSAYSLPPGAGLFTMGTGGIWATGGRPVKIKGAKVTFQGLEQGVRVMAMGAFEQSLAYTERPAVIEYLANGQPVSPALAAWATGAMPTKLGEDSAAPLKNIRIHPIPTVAGGNIELSYWTPLAQFVALTDTVTFPVPGYELALINELSAVLAISYGRADMLPTLTSIAERSKARINIINTNIEIEPPAAAPAAA